MTELDLMWLFGVVDDRPAVVELRPGELTAAVARHDAIADPQARDADRVWWNWSRMPAGFSAGNGEAGTVAVMPWVVPRLAELVGRDLAGERSGGGARAPCSGCSGDRAGTVRPARVPRRPGRGQVLQLTRSFYDVGAARAVGAG